MGRQAKIVCGESPLGIIGEVHPRITSSFDIPDSVYMLELDLNLLLPHTLGVRAYKPIPRFPAVIRDVAVVVDENIPAGKLIDIIRSFPLVEEVVLFDLYTLHPVPEGKKSLAFRITFRSPERTLTDEEVGEVQGRILERLKRETGAKLRGSAL